MNSILSNIAKLLVLTAVSTTEAGELGEIQRKSAHLWMSRLLLNYYSVSFYPNPNDTDIKAGSAFYQHMKPKGFVENGTSGFAHDFPLSDMRKLPALWQKNKFIFYSEQWDQEDVLQLDWFKSIREHMYVRKNGDIIYGVTGFMKLSNNSQTGTVMFAFRRFRLEMQENPSIAYLREKNSCVLWGIICETVFKVSYFDRGISHDLAMYFRYEVLTQFLEQKGVAISNLEREADKYKSFLPTEVKDALAKIESNPDKRHDEILAKDPLNGNNFES